MDQIIIPVVLGLIIIALGVTNIMGNISTLHWYHRQRVSPQDVRPFGKLVGTGMVVIGTGIVLSGVGIFVTQRTGSEGFTAVGSALAVAGVVIGLPIIFYAMFKYNKGIF